MEFTFNEYADMYMLYGFCGGNAEAASEAYHQNIQIDVDQAPIHSVV